MDRLRPNGEALKAAASKARAPACNKLVRPLESGKIRCVPSGIPMTGALNST